MAPGVRAETRGCLRCCLGTERQHHGGLNLAMLTTRPPTNRVLMISWCLLLWRVSHQPEGRWLDRKQVVGGVLSAMHGG